MDHVVGQILVQIGQGVGILTQGLILAPEPVSGGHTAKLGQVHHVQGGNVVGPGN